MWGICLDSNTLADGLFQKVIQYEIDNANNKVIVLEPKYNQKLDLDKIKELPEPPKYKYGEQVVPCGDPDMVGVIVSIIWHFNLNCCFYKISVDGKIKRKRYFETDLILLSNR